MDGEYKEEQPTDLSVREEGQDEDLTDELDQLDVETNEEKLMEEPKEEDSRPINDSPASNESISSSSSKRKQPQPQKNPVDSATSEENGTSDGNRRHKTGELCPLENADDRVEQSVSPTPTMLEEQGENPLDKLSALQSQLTSPNLHDMMEAQRRLCNNMFEQQKKLLQQQNEVGRDGIRETGPIQEKPKMRDFSLLAQALKTELNENLSSIVDKVLCPIYWRQLEVLQILKEWAADIARLTAEAQRQQTMPPMFPHFSQPNPLSFGMPPGTSWRVQDQHRYFRASVGNLSSFQRVQSTGRVVVFATADDGRRHQAKKGKSDGQCEEVERGHAAGQGLALLREEQSPGTVTSRITGNGYFQLNLTGASLASYFPPTMVGHPLYGGAAFPDREDSPTNSDDNSDCGPYDASQRYWERWDLGETSLFQHEPQFDASPQGQADVLLHALPQLDPAQELLPGHPLQQEQHGPAGQMVQQLQVGAPSSSNISVALIAAQARFATPIFYWIRGNRTRRRRRKLATV